MAAVPKHEEDKVYVAEIVSESPTGSRRELNISMVSTIAVSIVFLLMAMSFGKAVINNSNSETTFSGDWWDTPLHLRHTMDLPMNMMRAQLPVNGTYEAEPYLSLIHI